MGCDTKVPASCSPGKRELSAVAKARVLIPCSAVYDVGNVISALLSTCNRQRFGGSVSDTAKCIVLPWRCELSDCPPPATCSDTVSNVDRAMHIDYLLQVRFVNCGSGICID